MKKLTLIVAIMLGVLGGRYAFAETVAVEGAISSVIVYRGQALVTRTIETKLPAGTSELIVGRLPEKIVPESLYSQGPGNVTILSVRYREKAVREDTREEVKKLDGEIEQVQTKLRLINKKLEHLKQQLERFEKLSQFSLTAEHSDLNRGLLQFEPLKGMTDYVEQKADAYHEKLVETGESIITLEKELKHLQRKRKKLAAGHSRTEREAIVFLNKDDNKPVAIEISYLVNGANWSPQYNLRAYPDKSTAMIEYNAVVHQSSGENWNNTVLALSTAEPSLVASPPYLEPMEITLTKFVEGYSRRINSREAGDMQAASASVAGQIEYIDRSKQFDELIRSRKSQSKGGRQAQSSLNEIAFNQQMLEFEADKKALKEMKAQIARIRRTEGVSVMYKVPGKLTLPSRSDQQLLTIATVKTKAEFILMAAPLLTDYVYLQAEILNDSETILLPGPASMYRNGEFVGKGRMELVTIGQKFTTGFGIDSQIQVVREFKDKKVDTLWGNRIDDHKYRIEINNYKDKAVNLRLLERLPFTDNPNIEITLLEPSHELSKDAEYLRTEREKGILRWDLTLKANSASSNATVVEYGFTMKYDNDMRVQPIKKHQ